MKEFSGFSDSLADCAGFTEIEEISKNLVEKARSMELRTFAEIVLFSENLNEKLRMIEEPMTDRDPGEPLLLDAPMRPEELVFAPRRTAPAMPSPATFDKDVKKGIAHHIMANHELQAVEVMAWILCRFPDSPSDFRQQLFAIIQEEQRHTRMHIERANHLGVPFGSYPVNGYIWKKSLDFQSPLDYVSGMALVFECRNLDHSLEFEQYFLNAGDKRSAKIMRRIHQDEIGHVKFGIDWLRKWKSKSESDWECWIEHLHWPIRPAKAIGDIFHREPRLDAGLSEDFVNRLETFPQEKF